MSKAAQLKKKASEFEQKKQYDRALAMYVQAIEAAVGIPEETDIPLYNRVGDLYLRLGDLEQAVAYYEMAVDLYAEGGFFNNAIALCNKVLRHSPSRSSIYYKLGKISASKGFNSDAKQNFLEYADRMQKDGQIDEAFRALKEFADLCPGQDDVRLMLAEQLARVDRKEEAVEQLHIVYETMVAEDRGTEAAATLERMRALDPAAEPKRGRAAPQEKRDGLVFIDVNYEAPPADVVEVHTPVELTPASADTLLDGRPLTAAEFGNVDLPASADPHIERTLDDSPLSGIAPREDPLSALAASMPVDTIEPFDVNASGGLSNDFIVDEPTMFTSDAAEAGAIVPFADEAHDPFSPMGLAPEVPDVPLERDPAFEFSGDMSPDPSSLTFERFDQGDMDLSGIHPGNPGDLELDSGISLGDIDRGAMEIISETPEIVPPLEPVPSVLEPEEFVDPDSVVGVEREDDYFVDLQQWLAESEKPKSPRMKGEDEAQHGGEIQTDFSNMLNAFKRGIAENVEDSDSDSHYDLGVAYMEMGLTDEAIAQFQRVIRSDAPSDRRMRAYESLGQCFIERKQYSIAATSLSQALSEPRLGDDKLVGVLFLLGFTEQMQGHWQASLGYYQRVFAVDIHFRDVSDRLRIVQDQIEGQG